MTTERYIQLIEERFNEVKEDMYSAGMKSETTQKFLNIIETYIEIIKNSDESYYDLYGATTVFYNLLLIRLEEKSKEFSVPMNEIKEVNSDNYDYARSLLLPTIEMTHLSMSIFIILVNIDIIIENGADLQKLIRNASKKYKSKNDYDKKKCDSELLAYEFLIDEPSFEEKGITTLKKLIGSRRDFDYFMSALYEQ